MREDIIPAPMVLDILKDWYIANNPPTEKGKYTIYVGTDGSAMILFQPLEQTQELEVRERKYDHWDVS